MAHDLDSRKITCPVCGKRGTLLSDRSDSLHWVAHTEESTFFGQVSGDLIPVVTSDLCDIRDHVAEILKKELPSKRVGKR